MPPLLTTLAAADAPEPGEVSHPRDDREETRRRTAIIALVLVLLAGSAAAFAISEGLKVQKATIAGTHVDKSLSPVCDCPTARATIAFRLTRPDRLAIAVVDSGGHVVRTLVRERLFGRGKHHFTWNGRDDAGAIVPEGNYRPRVRILGSGRTLVLPNPMRVDVTPPRVTTVAVRPRRFSPDGDRRADAVRISYGLSEHAHGVLYVNGRQRVLTRFQRLHESLAWYGRVAGRPLPPGRYRLSVAAVDRAGNRSRPVAAGAVVLRYVGLPRRLLPARAGQPLTVRVSTDAKVVRWTLRRGASVVGRGSGGSVLVLRAPSRAGRYTLTVEAAGHRARGAVAVRRG